MKVPVSGIVATGLQKAFPIGRGGMRSRRFSSVSSRPSSQLRVLDDVSFATRDGEVLGILGTNGSGKTTLFKLLAGILLPDAGTAIVNGHDIRSERGLVRESVSFLSTTGWMLFDYGIRLSDNLLFWAVAEGLEIREARERVAHALKVVGLKNKERFYPQNLSTGMRQRANLARALLADKPILLLDEPTSGIDPASVVGIKRFIREELMSSRRSILLATNNMWEAESTCDRVAFLHKGRIALIDDVANLKRTTGAKCAVIGVKKSDSSHLEESLRKLPFVRDLAIEASMVRVYGDVETHFPELLNEVSRIPGVLSVALDEPSLTEIFLQVVGGDSP